MTGLNRLRALAGEWDEWGFGGSLTEIADEIECELSEERDRWDDDLSEAQVAWNRVAAVMCDMERHCLGHEGMEDSPVARWARELRGALKSDASDGPEAQNPSCVDSAETADVTSDAQKVTRDPAEDVSMSAYDLLPADERDAIAWVRDHGGLDSVKKLLDWVVGHCSTKQQLDFDFWLSGRVMYELGFEEDMADRDEVEGRLLARLMPEGMEWPRFEDGEKLTIDNAPIGVEGVEFPLDASGYTLCCGVGPKRFRFCERVRRPAVLAGDGVPIRKDERVFGINGGQYRVTSAHDGKVFARHVDGPSGAEVESAGGDGLYRLRADQLTHTKPDPPDSWEKIEEDALNFVEDNAGIPHDQDQMERDMLAILRRCRALAERERGER